MAVPTRSRIRQALALDMFKKQPSIKNYSALKSSDRRRFQSDVFDAYPVIKEFHSVEGAPSFFTEDLQKAKFSSHIDDLGLVYAMDNSPTWFQVNGPEPIPTVYTLWKYPNMLPTLNTWPFVISKLINGADLMIPGLVAGSEGLPNLKAGDLVAICINGYKYPLAIGRMALDTSNIAVRSGMKGKAVNLIHVYQDCLWAMGDKSDPPNLQSIERAEDTDDEEDEEDVDDLAHQTQSRLTVEEQKEGNQDIPENEPLNAEEKPQLSTKDIDQLLKDTFYHALVYKLTKGHSPELLPMSASTLYSTYMLPSRPLVNGLEVDVKKSSWKKMQKFLKDMEKAGVCKLKDRKGETHVVSINWSHEALMTAKKYKTLESKPAGAAEKSASSEASTGTPGTAKKDSNGATQIQLYYKPKKDTARIFEVLKKDTKQAYNSQEVRTILMEYVEMENLIDAQEKRMIRIDPLLCDAVLKKEEYMTIDRLQRDQLLQRFLDQMQRMHMIALPGQEPILRDGSPRNVLITLETRQGRKTMTKVTGVEWYGLSVDEVCKDLTRRCASSVTANPIHGSSPKNPQQEIMVQGPQTKHVTELLLSQGVPKKYIEVVDKTGKGKKK